MMKEPLNIWHLICVGMWFGFGFTAGTTLFTTAIPRLIEKIIVLMK